MSLNIILGITVDTIDILKYLKKYHENERTIVIDYENTAIPEFAGEIEIYDPSDAKKIIKNYNVIKFYKSIYLYPRIRD